MIQYDTLFSKDLQTLSTVDALESLGSLIDLSIDLKRVDGIQKAFEWCNYLHTQKLFPQELVLLDYFESNAWAALQHVNATTTEPVWHWHQPEIKKQIFLLRRAISSPAFSGLNKVFRCKVFTNLANALRSIGRFVEAISYWDQALLIEPRFAMAQGNRAYGLYYYARSLYDNGHAELFLKFSYDGFSAAIKQDAIYDCDYPVYIKENFLIYKNHLATYLRKSLIRNRYYLKNNPLGRSKEEKNYRLRCLQNKLFLNPLNDLGTHTIASQDILTLPGLHSDINAVTPPRIIVFFNQIKQEYVSARWLFINGTEFYSKPHYSDKDVLLYSMLDYSTHSLSCEKIKMAYRAAYSIFDKIAYFLNFYLNLGIKESNINFNKIWYKNKDKDHALRDQIASLKNLPLRGLFWLSHDLFDEELQEVASPEAKELHKMRNYLEHKHLNIHEFPIQEKMGTASVGDIGYSITRDHLEEKTLHVLQLARAALIYLSLGVHVEEQRHKKSNSDHVYARMSLFPIDDELKI